MLETASLADKDHWMECMRKLFEGYNNPVYAEEKDEVDDYIRKQREANQLLIAEIRRRRKLVDSAEARLANGQTDGVGSMVEGVSMLLASCK